MGEGVFLGGYFFGDVSFGEVSFLVGEGGGVLLGEVNGDLGGEVDDETDVVFEGDGGGDGSSSLMVVGMTLVESSMTSGSSWLVTSGFGISNRTVLGFLNEEVDSELHPCKLVKFPNGLIL